MTLYWGLVRGDSLAAFLLVSREVDVGKVRLLFEQNYGDVERAWFLWAWFLCGWNEATFDTGHAHHNCCL